MSTSNPPDDSGPAAVRVELDLEVAARCDWDVPAELPAELDLFAGFDWDEFFEGYIPSCASARLMTLEPAESDLFDHDHAQRAIISVDIHSDWETDGDEFVERMRHEWNEGFQLPGPVPWFMDTRVAFLTCRSAQRIPADSPPELTVHGAQATTRLAVGCSDILSGWSIVGSGLPATRRSTRLIRDSLGELMDWIDLAADGLFIAACMTPVKSGSFLEHESYSRVAIVPDLRPSLSHAVTRGHRDDAEAAAREFRIEALAHALHQIGEIAGSLPAFSEHTYDDRVVIWPLVNLGPAWRPESQHEALEGLTRCLDRPASSHIQAVSLSQQRTNPFEFQMDASTVGRLLRPDGTLDRSLATSADAAQVATFIEVDPAGTGCPAIDGLRLWKLT